VAQKIDLFVLSGGDGDNDYEGADLDSFLDDEGLADRDFDIAGTILRRKHQCFGWFII